MVNCKFERATQEQLQHYVSFCRQHPKLLAGKNNPKAPNIVQELWSELAEELNSLRGPTRSAVKWKENLGVWKCQLRTRARKVHLNQRMTGGGPCMKGLREFAISTFGRAAVEVVKHVPALGISIPIAEADNCLLGTECASVETRGMGSANARVLLFVEADNFLLELGLGTECIASPRASTESSPRALAEPIPRVLTEQSPRVSTDRSPRASAEPSLGTTAHRHRTQPITRQAMYESPMQSLSDRREREQKTLEALVNINKGVSELVADVRGKK